MIWSELNLVRFGIWLDYKQLDYLEVTEEQNQVRSRSDSKSKTFHSSGPDHPVLGDVTVAAAGARRE